MTGHNVGEIPAADAVVDFEAKVLAVMQKAQAAHAKNQVDTAGHTLNVLQMLDQIDHRDTQPPESSGPPSVE